MSFLQDGLTQMAIGFVIGVIVTIYVEYKLLLRIHKDLDSALDHILRRDKAKEKPTS